MQLAMGIIALFILIAAVAGVVAMFLGKRWLARLDVVMGILPGILLGVVIFGLIAIGGLI